MLKAQSSEFLNSEITASPDSLIIEFSHESGYYDSSFDLRIAYKNDSSRLYYTLDGSHPGISLSAKLIPSGETISINPESSNGRGVTPAVIVRTSFRIAGNRYSAPQSRTFIFLDKVIHQQYPGADWPSGSINSQKLDYAVDQRITTGSTYKYRIKDAFLSLPVISLITDNRNLFSPDSGIYVNASGHGPEWERECSVELFFPDSLGFYCNAGLRIRGGWSRHPNFPKHSFRLFFRSEYGNSKLEYPLFGIEGVNQFDKIDLRTSQNYAWAQGDSRNTMLRDVFSRDTQRDMGQAYTRSRFYHLYINGMYWGIYQTQERSEARFAADYFGGKPEDYDVVKVNTENWDYRIEATDGNLDGWEEVYNLTQKGFSDMEPYYRLEGKDANGRPDKHLYKLVDIDNLIDYMISIFYTGNFDAPTSSFGGNKGANNFYAINQRNNRTTGFVFFNHDAEHAMFARKADPGIGLYEDRVNLGTRNDNLRMNVSWFGAFHPQWLHFKLSENPEYRNRFSDRVYKHFRFGGALCQDSILARFDSRKEEIDVAIIAESARWGDAAYVEATSYNRDFNWIKEVSSIREEFIPYRRQIVIDQLRSAGIFSELHAPILKIDEKQVITEDVRFRDDFYLNIINDNPSGNIYYTNDGNDPRSIGGEINISAINGGDELQLSMIHSSIIKSRIFDNGIWSPLNSTSFLDSTEDYSSLKISEIQYNPLDSIYGKDTISGNQFEFIEFKNTGDHGINLEGLRLDSAVDYTFPDASVLLPKQFFVVASSYIDFFERYGAYASGTYYRNLSNNGELITLYDRDNNPLLRFSYNDNSPWPINADGQGYSLVSKLVDPEGSPQLYEYWNSSHKIGGSPFSNDLNSEGISNITEVSNSFKLYPNPASRHIIVESVFQLNKQEVRLKLYNLSGKIVFSAIAKSGNMIDISGAYLPNGVYLAEISSQEHTDFIKLIIIR